MLIHRRRRSLTFHLRLSGKYIAPKPHLSFCVLASPICILPLNPPQCSVLAIHQFILSKQPEEMIEGYGDVRAQ